MELREPKHGDVKAVRKLQREILFKFAKDLDLENLEELDEETILRELSKDPILFAEFSTELEDLRLIGTIILATGMEKREIEELSEKEFWGMYNESKEFLGGDIEDFLQPYEAAIMSPQKVEANEEL